MRLSPIVALSILGVIAYLVKRKKEEDAKVTVPSADPAAAADALIRGEIFSEKPPVDYVPWKPSMVPPFMN